MILVKIVRKTKISADQFIFIYEQLKAKDR